MSKIPAPTIRKLDEATVNRIAAGEVVQNPSAAIKEMLENSLDAGATSVTIVAKGGGMQLLQIIDNGHGIRKHDLEIVCERFTTSKIASYNDLQSVSTFGFRGEALASITHVAHVQIVTRTADQQCAFKAKYSDGKLIPLKKGDRAEAKPCAGTVGTSITVEDLFYNMSTRKQAFKNPSDQYQRILDVVTKYAIHYGHQKISMTCKKHGQSIPDLHTSSNSNTLDNIKTVFGSSVGKELLKFETSYGNQDYLTGTCKPITSNTNDIIFSCNGYISNPNYSNKKSICILFINHRLIECTAIKRVIDSIYSEILPKHSHPFIYLSFQMLPQNIDVNVHPTKKEVHFMYEDKVLEAIYISVKSQLQSANDSRVFYTQTMLLNTGTVSLPQNTNKQNEFTDKNLNNYNNINSIKSGSGKYSVQSETQSSVSNELSEGQEEQEEQEHRTRSRKRPLKAMTSFTCTDNESKTELNTESFDSRERVDIVTEHRNMGSEPAKKLNKPSSQSVAPNKLVRVDPMLSKIDSFFMRASASESKQLSTSSGREEERYEASEKTDVLDSCICQEVSQTDVPTGGEEGQDFRDTSAVENIATMPTAVSDGRESEAKPSMKSVSRAVPGAFVSSLRRCACCERPRVGVGVGVGVGHRAESSGRVDKAALQDNMNMDSSILTTQDESTPTSYPLSLPLPPIIDSKCQLTSVQQLLSTIRENRHAGLAQLLKKHSLVGVIDEEFLLVQYGTQLLLIDHAVFSREMFYQIVLRRFGSFSSIKLETPIIIKDFLMAAIASPKGQWTPEDGDKETLAIRMTSLLMEKKDMLSEYFGIIFDETAATLTALPELVPDYKPSGEALPLFLLHLAVSVDWMIEDNCFDCIAQELAEFYSQLPSLTATEVEHGGSASPATSISLIVTERIWPAVKAYLIPPREFLTSGRVVQVAALEQLYRIFERC